MPRKTSKKMLYKCEHCGKEHEIDLRLDYTGPVLFTVCPITNKGVCIENV